MVTALIYLCGILIVLSLAVILIFGAKNAGSRLAGESKLVIAAFALPALLVLVFFALNQGHPEGAWTMAFIWASIVTGVLALIALLISGIKGLVS